MIEHRRRTLASGLFVALGVAAVFLVLRTRPTSEEPGGATRLPIGTLAAREGDWATYLVTSIEGDRKSEPEPFALRVVAVEAGRIRLRFETRHRAGDLFEGATRELPADRQPTVAEVFAPPGVTAVFQSVKLAKDRRVLGTRTFECARVVYDRASDGALVHVVASVSAEVPGAILSVSATGTDQHGCPTTVLWELAGMGHGDHTLMGRSLDELAGVGAAAR